VLRQPPFSRIALRKNRFPSVITRFFGIYSWRADSGLPAGGNDLIRLGCRIQNCTVAIWVVSVSSKSVHHFPRPINNRVSCGAVVVGGAGRRLVGFSLGGRILYFCKIWIALEKAPSLGIATSSQIAKNSEFLMLRCSERYDVFMTSLPLR
jgi:hypothetical protein